MSLKLEISKQVAKSLEHLPPKHFKQILGKIMKLLEDPYPQDFKKIKVGEKEYSRVDNGEYRIIYRVNTRLLTLVLIDKRNDDSVYKTLKRK
jgi:mRNA interferase RelE/StbE